MLRKEYDVVICGGGVAGVAAALASARRGMNTALIEKTILPGGLATSGLVLVYLYLCDGKGHQLIHGISEELLNAANRYGPCDPNLNWRSAGRYCTRFSPGSFVLALDELLEDAGVDVWLDSTIIGCTVRNERLTDISVANKSGTIRIGAKVFVDSTGDADLSFLAGKPCRFSENSMVLWTIEHNEHVQSENDFDGCSHVAIHADPLERVYITKNLSGKMVTDFILAGRRRYRDLLKQEYGDGKSSRKTHYPLTLQTIPPIRKGRCIQGCFTLDSGMEGRSFEDPVGVFGDWRCSGKIWQIPYRALLPENLNGVIAAGRCISSIGDAWEATRVIPVSAMTGEIAGTAAALSVSRGKTPHDLAYSELADELRKVGFLLEFPH